MIRKPLSLGWRVGLALASLTLLIGLYSAASYRQHQANPHDTTIPDFGQLKEGIAKITTPHKRTGEVWIVEDSKATGKRLALGLLVGVGLAVFLGFLMGTWSPAEAFLSPPMTLMAKLNPMAMLAVFFVFAGIGLEMFIAIVAFGIVPSLAITIYLSAKHDVPEELINKSYTLGASHFETIWHVIGHSVLPKVIEGIRLQIGPALVYLIAAEMIVGSVGFGYRIRLEQKLTHMNTVYAYIAILGMFGFGLDMALRWLLHWSCPWYTKSAVEEPQDGIFQTLWKQIRGPADGDEEASA